MKIKVPEINTREELRAFVDSLSKKQLEEIREEFLDGFADAYRVDRSDANAAYIGFFEGCMRDWYDEIYDMLGGCKAGLKTGTAYRERMGGQD